MDSPARPLIYRQTLWTRLTHWVWAVCLFFLMLSGLQIFNAHPALYVGQESGFEYDNVILQIGARQNGDQVQGFTDLFGVVFDTTGWLGVQGTTVQAFPAALTVPSNRSLATGRVIHFFFAWVLVGTLLVWALAAALTGHLRAFRIGRADLAALPGEILSHARLKFHHTRDYNVLQKLAYAGVLFILLPLMILTGLSMSPGFNAIAPWLLDLFGGRQTARTLHFVTMVLLVGFFVIHMLMILAAGPINELRSMTSGWYRLPGKRAEPEEIAS